MNQTGRNTYVTACLLQACYLAVIKPISGCVHIACSSLMITSLLQVVNRLDASWFSRLFIHKLDTSCFEDSHQACKYQVASSLTFTDLIQLGEANRLDAAWWLALCNFQGKIQNFLLLRSCFINFSCDKKPGEKTHNTFAQVSGVRSEDQTDDFKSKKHKRNHKREGVSICDGDFSWFT